jgi:hypothetical protein
MRNAAREPGLKQVGGNSEQVEGVTVGNLCSGKLLGSRQRYAWVEKLSYLWLVAQACLLTSGV